MANQDVGSGKITALAADELTLVLTCRLGPLLAVHFELARAGSGSSKLEQRAWTDLDFHKQNPREWRLCAIAAPGKYLITVVPLLLLAKTELEVDLIKSGTLVYRRTSNGKTGVVDAIQQIMVTRKANGH